jgi:predicted nucleic acid-binding protein
VVEHIQGLSSQDTLFMPVIAQAEHLAGVEVAPLGKRKEELRKLYEETLEQTAEVLIVDSRIAIEFARIYAQLRSAGKPIGTNDIWIAAIAMAHQSTLVTSDPDFAHVAGLRLEDWSTA